MIIFRIIAAAMLFASISEARDGWSQGGSIVIVDLDTGATDWRIEEPDMFDGQTQGLAQLSYEWGPQKRTIRARWDDVVPSTAPYASLNGRIHQEMEFSVPSLSTGIVSSTGPWTSAELRPVIASTVTLKPAAQQGALAVPEDWEFESFKTKDVVIISRDGYALDAVESGTGEKLWSLDLNPEHYPLPGPSPQVSIFEIETALLVVTDRLGLWSIDPPTGRVNWRLPYQNIDVRPSVALIGKRLLVGPVSGLPKSSLRPKPRLPD
jgi:outer membrane protein assembly factor BamB